MAKLHRRPGLAVLTAGPGVTNGVSGLTSAFFNASPVLVLGGRAPAFRWGSGSLQEMDHLPLVAPVTKHAETVFSTDDIPRAVDAALAAALTPHRGRPSSTSRWRSIFSVGEATLPAVTAVDADRAGPGGGRQGGRADRRRRSARSSSPAPTSTRATPSPRCARRPRRCGCRSSPTAWAAARSRPSTRWPSPRPAGPRSSGADVVVVVGTPLDFRLGFGDFGDAQVVHIVDAPSQRADARAAGRRPRR